MKKLLTFCTLYFSLFEASFGQSFKCSADKQNDTLSASFTTTYEFRNTIFNLDNDPLYINWHVQLSASYLPHKWDAGICDNVNCYVYTGSDHMSGVIAPGNSADWIVSIIPDVYSYGTGWVTESLTDEKGITTKVVTYILEKSPTGIISTTISENNLILYPNPTQSVVNITTLRPVTICITSIQGKTLLLFRNVISNINVSQLESGMYFIHVYDEHDLLLKTEKLVKNN